MDAQKIASMVEAMERVYTNSETAAQRADEIRMALDRLPPRADDLTRDEWEVVARTLRKAHW